MLATCSAATLNITATFTPSISYPENNSFINTTAQSGFCATWPAQCTNGEKSLGTGLVLTPSKGLTPQDDKRESLFFKWPSNFRNITITNTETGYTQTLRFRISSFSGRYTANRSALIYNWEGSPFSMRPRGGCSPLSDGWMIGGAQVAWLWGIPEGNAGCYNITTSERPVGENNFINKVDDLSFGYELNTPDPLKMNSGIYTGTLTLNIGPGGDIDFGDNFRTSDTELIINFTLSVNHELKLSTIVDDHKVSLQPCTSGRICNEDEGQANWERWMVSRVPPQLAGRSNFNLSSSGVFSVYLECEQQSGSDCALRSDNMPSRTVPVRALLTLPDNIVDTVTGTTVSKRRLEVGRDLTKNVFSSTSFGQHKAGSIDFRVSEKDVETMLTTRPDTYRGAVTVIFDPAIY